ncbi:hypothetical protein pipiens_006716, partial [Culex pipiens pipiens]
KNLFETDCQKYADKNIRISWAAPLVIDPEPIPLKAPNCSDSIDLIVNGEEAGEGEFPHQAVLGYASNETGNIGGYQFLCGGSLISERFVLTAAHCGPPQVVRLGVFDLREIGDGLIFDVAAFYKHPNYSMNASYDDIALVKIARDVSFTSHVRPACLWTDTALESNHAYESSNHLMKVRLQIKARESCVKKFKFQRKFRLGIQNKQLCIGSQQNGTDTCQGDSGGPIQTITDPKSCMYHVVGVTSTGASCGGGKADNVYIQVASYLDWIERIVWV